MLIRQSRVLWRSLLQGVSVPLHSGHIADFFWLNILLLHDVCVGFLMKQSGVCQPHSPVNFKNPFYRETIFDFDFPRIFIEGRTEREAKFTQNLCSSKFILVQSLYIHAA